MTATLRRLLGGCIALAALVAAKAAMPSVEEARERSAMAAGESRADNELARAVQILEARIRLLEARVSAAANRKEVGYMLAALRPADPVEPFLRTLENGFRDEPWWDSFRREFAITALSFDTDPPELVVGANREDVRAGPLLAQSRAQGLTSGIVLVNDTPFAAAAEPLTVTGRPPAILLLAKPLDASFLADERQGVACALELGGRLVARVGAEEDIAMLAQAASDEAKAKTGPEDTRDKRTAAPDTSWVAIRRPLGPRLGLWVLVANTEAAAQAARTATTTRAAIWGGAALIAFLALFFTFRPSAVTTASAAQVNQSMPDPVGPSFAKSTGTASSLGSVGERPPTGGAMTAASVSGIAATQSFPGLPGTPGVAGRTFGRYTLLDPLGEGGMARVFTAVTFGAEGFRRKFVIKRLRPELTGEPAVVSQFIDEAKLASTLVHSNIVPVFDFGKVGEEYFLATEYILGRDLGRVVQRCHEQLGHALPVDLLLFTASEILRALDYAHTRRSDHGRPIGIVHRDVSPSNVLVSARGEVKLFDFGIVKAEGRVTRTQHGVVKGNVSFMSPEQARGANVDARADLFSLGLVLYYCAAGETLYAQTGTSYELLVKAAGGPGPEERARLLALPEPLPALLERSLATDPERRFQSAAEFGAAIAAFGLRAGAADLERFMNRLFGPDFAAEELRFANLPPGDSGLMPTTSPQVSPPSPVTPNPRTTKT